MAKSIKSMTKVELIKVVVEQGKRLERAKFYYRQQRAHIVELIDMSNKAVKLLNKKVNL